MRPGYFTFLARLVLLITALLAAQTHVSAQSGVDLIAHYVEVIPNDDAISYTVNVYLSVIDDTSSPMRDMPAQAFSILEDGQQVEIQKLSVMAEEPTTIVLVMDTSGSMGGQYIDDAKAAAAAFVSGLKASDQIAILTFDNTFKTRADFTSDQGMLSREIEEIKTTPSSGTCLYDAAFAAVSMFADRPTGNRAVILFTDGRDENAENGSFCSKSTEADVLNAAAKGKTRAPIYTVGLGSQKQLDTKTLQNLSQATGGYYLPSLDSSSLANTFQVFSTQLRTQYILTYRSVAVPGDHRLTVKVNTSGEDPSSPEDEDSREFLLPALSPRLSFMAPLEGETISDSLRIAVSLASQGQTVIERVAFEVNGVEVGSDPTTPYELDLDTSSYPAGVVTLTAVAYGTSNAVLARTSLNVIRPEPIEVVEVIPTVPIPTAPIVEAPAQGVRPVALLGIALGVLGISAILLLIFNLVRQQKTVSDDEESSELDDNLLVQARTKTPPRPMPAFERNVPGELESSTDALGALIVEACDDDSMVGHRFEIISERTTLGRSAENDINFPKDTPVSRKHAEVLEKDGKLYLKQVTSTDSSGATVPPRYGTAVNQNPLDLTPHLLSHGDEILLGRRVRLRFAAYTKAKVADELTRDEMDADEDIDRTQEQ